MNYSQPPTGGPSLGVLTPYMVHWDLKESNDTNMHSTGSSSHLRTQSLMLFPATAKSFGALKEIWESQKNSKQYSPTILRPGLQEFTGFDLLS